MKSDFVIMRGMTIHDIVTRSIRFTVRVPLTATFCYSQSKAILTRGINFSIIVPKLRFYRYHFLFFIILFKNRKMVFQICRTSSRARLWKRKSSRKAIFGTAMQMPQDKGLRETRRSRNNPEKTTGTLPKNHQS